MNLNQKRTVLLAARDNFLDPICILCYRYDRICSAQYNKLQTYSRLSALSFWKSKKKKNIFVPNAASHQRQWARSDNFCGPDQQAVTNVGLIVLARQSKKVNVTHGKLHQAHLRWLIPFQMSVFPQMKLCSHHIYFPGCKIWCFPQDYLKLNCNIPVCVST